jgi:hypothetical protein
MALYFYQITCYITSMDDNDLITYARSRFSHESAKKLLKEKYQAKMLFAHAGGMWCAGPELLGVLNCCTMDKLVVLLDLYHNPVQINTKTLWNLASQRWQENMNAWLVEYEELGQKR